MREAHLPFEGFLEALCRVAALKALPTDEEIQGAHCVDADMFLVTMRADDEVRYATFLAERASKWGARPRQPFERCVAHVVSMLLGTVRRGTGDTGFGPLSKQQVQKWAKADIKAFAKFSGGKAKSKK